MSVVPTCGQNPRHTDLHPRIDVYLTSWFILSGLFLTGGELSVVRTCGRDPLSHNLHPRIDVYLTRWFILSVWYLTGGDTSVVPTCLGALITGTSTLVGTST